MTCVAIMGNDIKDYALSTNSFKYRFNDTYKQVSTVQYS